MKGQILHDLTHIKKQVVNSQRQKVENCLPEVGETQWALLSDVHSRRDGGDDSCTAVCVWQPRTMHGNVVQTGACGALPAEARGEWRLEGGGALRPLPFPRPRHLYHLSGPELHPFKIILS